MRWAMRRQRGQLLLIYVECTAPRCFHQQLRACATEERLNLQGKVRADKKTRQTYRTRKEYPVLLGKTGKNKHPGDTNNPRCHASLALSTHTLLSNSLLSWTTSHTKYASMRRFMLCVLGHTTRFPPLRMLLAQNRMISGSFGGFSAAFSSAVLSATRATAFVAASDNTVISTGSAAGASPSRGASGTAASPSPPLLSFALPSSSPGASTVVASALPDAIAPSAFRLNMTVICLRE